VLVSAATQGLWPTTVFLAIFFLVLLAVLVGATVLGIVGALVAISVAAAAKVVLAQQIAEHEATAVPARPHLHPWFHRRPGPTTTTPAP
jgi:hypothetical protein